MTTKKYIAACGVQLLACGALFAVEPEWSTVIFDCASIEQCEITDGHFRIFNEGGPDGKPAVVFDDSVNNGGTIGVDLSDLDINFNEYDELRFDYFQENGITFASVGLWGDTASRPLWHWYSLKRFQKIGEWDDVRFDLHFDDDGPAMTKEYRETPGLVVKFSKSPENRAAALPGIRARIANVRLVKTPVRAEINTRNVRYEKTDNGLFFHHPLHLTNRTTEELTSVIEVVPETLEKFQVKELESVLPLKPGESRIVDICLWLPTADVKTLPKGYVERGLVKVTVKELPGYDVIPLRSLRPVYLFAIIPPEEPEEGWLRSGTWTLSENMEKHLEDSLNWKFEAPFDVAPRYSPLRRCPKCKGTQLVFKDLFHYCCKNKNCENVNKVIELKKDDTLFGANLGKYHTDNALLARNYALAYRNTGDERFGKKAVEILTTYADVLGKLKKVGNIPSWDTPLASSVIFVPSSLLKPFVEAYLAVKDGKLLTQIEAETIRQQFLVEMLHGINQFCYGISAGQLDFVLSQVESAPAIGHWYFLADALAGDASFSMMLDRAFDADGIAVEGGVYARRTTYRMVYAAEALKRLGVPIDETRVNQIVQNAMAVGFYSQNDPQPSWFEKSEPASAVLPNTGVTILLNGEGENWRKATINWGSNRDRDEPDLLSYDFLDEQGQFINETGRIDYGDKYSFFMSTTVAHNIPVVNEQNISMERKVQEYFRSDATAACCLIADTKETPAYPNARISRALVLVEGCLLVVDRVTVDNPATIDKVIYGFSGVYARPQEVILETSIKDLEPFKNALGTSRAYEVPCDLSAAKIQSEFEATWSRESRRNGKSALRVMFLGDAVSAFVGKSIGGVGARAVERSFLMVRKQGREFVPACLYEQTRGEDKNQIESFARIEIKDEDGKLAANGRAAAYGIEMADGSKIEVLISFDGGVYKAGECAVDAETRIAVASH